MKRTALILTVFITFSGIFASNPNDSITKALDDPSAKKIDVLCRALRGKNLTDLSESPQAEKFERVYGKSIKEVCSPNAFAALTNLMAAANTYTNNQTNDNALAFFDRMTDYIKAGGATKIYADLFEQAKNQTAQAIAGTRAGANQLSAAVTRIQNKFRNNPQTAPVAFIQSVETAFDNFAIESGFLLDNRPDFSNWIQNITSDLTNAGQIHSLLLAASGQASQNPFNQIAGFNYDQTIRMYQSVENALTAALNAGGAAAPAGNAQLEQYARDAKAVLQTLAGQAKSGGYGYDPNNNATTEITALRDAAYTAGTAPGIGTNMAYTQALNDLITTHNAQGDAIWQTVQIWKNFFDDLNAGNRVVTLLLDTTEANNLKGGSDDQKRQIKTAGKKTLEPMLNGFNAMARELKTKRSDLIQINPTANLPKVKFFSNNPRSQTGYTITNTEFNIALEELNQ
jgi:hypothetical protein